MKNCKNKQNFNDMNGYFIIILFILLAIILSAAFLY